MIGGCTDGSLHRCAGGGVALHGCLASFSITKLLAGTAALLKRAGCPFVTGRLVPGRCCVVQEWKMPRLFALARGATPCPSQAVLFSGRPDRAGLVDVAGGSVGWRGRGVNTISMWYGRADRWTRTSMSPEIITMLGVGVALALFMWQVTNRLDRRIDRLEGRVEGVARDLQSLAREFSEMRGEIRGRPIEVPVAAAEEAVHG